jgi:hypothetical protein
MNAKNQASTLVDIAKSIYTFGCAASQASHHHPGDPDPARYTWAAPKGNPNLKRPLHEIRVDLAAVYQAEYGAAPNRSALGDCMTVLEGIALKEAPLTGDESLLSLLMGTSGAKMILELAEERFTFGVTVTGEPYAVLKDGPNLALRFRGGRHSLRATVAKLYYEKHKNTAKAQDLADALLVLEGRAADLEPTDVALRVGRNPEDGRIILDLGREHGAAVAIGAGEWDIINRSPILFFRTAATLPLPRPVADGDLDGLRDLLNITVDDWPLIVAWEIAALFPDVPHPVLALIGEQGTAKSTAARLLVSLVDKCAAQLRTAPHDITDWAVACTGSWITALDNISDIAPWLSDAICRAVTGDGLLRRELYTTSGCVGVGVPSGGRTDHDRLGQSQWRPRRAAALDRAATDRRERTPPRAGPHAAVGTPPAGHPRWAARSHRSGAHEAATRSPRRAPADGRLRPHPRRRRRGARNQGTAAVSRPGPCFEPHGH